MKMNEVNAIYVI